MLHDLILMHIPIKFHEHSPNGYRVMGRTIIFGKKWKKAKGHNLESKKERTNIFHLNGYRVTGCMKKYPK